MEVLFWYDDVKMFTSPLIDFQVSKLRERKIEESGCLEMYR